ncbi:MAG TPA: hypothetical protein VGK85_11355, partial [Myxococcaceae bacterium]
GWPHLRPHVEPGDAGLAPGARPAFQMTKIGPITLDCVRLVDPDAGTIDRIARIQLQARRMGAHVRLENATEHLVALIELCGLAGALRVEMKRKSE